MHSWNFDTPKENYGKLRTCKGASHPLYPVENIHPQKNYLDITALVRSLQRADGERDCFRTSIQNCQIRDCRWREYCFEE